MLHGPMLISPDHFCFYEDQFLFSDKEIANYIENEFFRETRWIESPIEMDPELECKTF